MISSISISDFINKDIKQDIIDIRSIESYNNNHIPGSINVPFEKLIVNPSKYLNNTNKYYIYCQKGLKSTKTCQILQKKGYNVISIDGGYENWILEK